MSALMTIFVSSRKWSDLEVGRNARFRISCLHAKKSNEVWDSAHTESTLRDKGIEFDPFRMHVGLFTIFNYEGRKIASLF